MKKNNKFKKLYKSLKIKTINLYEDIKDMLTSCVSIEPEYDTDINGMIDMMSKELKHGITEFTEDFKYEANEICEILGKIEDLI